MKTKQKKQFTVLSDEDLKLVTGGGYLSFVDMDNVKSSSSAPINPSLTAEQAAETCPANQISFTDMFGKQICSPA